MILDRKFLFSLFLLWCLLMVFCERKLGIFGSIIIFFFAIDVIPWLRHGYSSCMSFQKGTLFGEFKFLNRISLAQTHQYYLWDTTRKYLEEYKLINFMKRSNENDQNRFRVSHLCHFIWSKVWLWLWTIYINSIPKFRLACGLSRCLHPSAP
jgi:hypothetical protein